MLEAVAAPPPASGVWASLRDAVRGTRQSYTDGPIGRAIVLLAVPMVLEMPMESVFAVMDVCFVSRLGAAAVATVGLTESLLVLVYTMAMGLSIGVTATVARRIGEGDAGRHHHRIAVRRHRPWRQRRHRAALPDQRGISRRR